MPDLLVPLDPTSAEHANSLALLIGEATRADGQPPFSDQSLVDLRAGARAGTAIEIDGEIAGISIMTMGAAPAEAELVVSPTHRRRGLGARLLADVLARSGGRALIWAHGDHPDARSLAARAGLEPVRELLQLRLAPVRAPDGAAEARAFRPGADDAEWLALNAVAFADHAEQGDLTQADLDARKAEPWFDPADFLIASGDDGGMIGFCWLKVEGGIGEFYAVGVSPAAQGQGLGRGLVSAGLERLEARGIRESNLYVEAENTAAVTLYRSVGFVDHSIDIQYSSRPSSAS
ncbi:mycothiol synthase [Marisediminicola antarctica]|uniref:Mycothiol acetyltransferase n=1 Tax=Marisediminicola antarctica TaxID=674079 RepID=A0A7L5AJ64_9MICO|nr:mycothiol synthase [Marisediminicola antarctica]QHO69171.1 mycothiol synthase [Marisediminicola antarctica]